MRALHLFSNWKWTGPAEPAVQLCRGLRALGLDARFACGRAPAREPGRTTVRDRAIERGIEPVLPELVLSKHVRIFRNLLDARRLRRYVTAERIDVVHAHLPNDHSLAWRAVGKSPDRRVVRSAYDGEGVKATFRQRRALARTDALICISRESMRRAAGDFGYPEDRTFLVESPIDLDRFDAARPGLLERGRALLDVGPEHFVLGIVARMQTHRRFEVLLEALGMAAAANPALRAVVIGRGTNQETVAKEPARRLGLWERMRFPGYVDGDDYVAALAALDAKVFLVPGSDGGCRAVREALAMGKPVIAARRGMLPEIVKHDDTGVVIEDDPRSLAGAIGRLGGDPAGRRRMGERAARDARERFSIARAAEDVRRIYERTLGRPRRIQPTKEGART